MLLLCHYIKFFFNVWSLMIPPVDFISEKVRGCYIIFTHKGGIRSDKAEENSYRLSLPLLAIWSRRSGSAQGCTMQRSQEITSQPCSEAMHCRVPSPLSHPAHPSSRWLMLAISHFISKYRKKELTAVFEWSQTTSEEIILKQQSLGRNH